MSPTRASIVIPTWNGRELLSRCLDALTKQANPPANEVIVIDNGSNDGTADWLRASHPQIRLIALDTNVGFAAAVNAGISASKSDYVILLNNDTEPEPEWLAALVSGLDRNTDFSFGVSKILRFDDPTRIDTAGDGFSVHGFAFKQGAGDPDGELFSNEVEVAMACGGASIYRRSTFSDVGLFEERFFAYFEDADWSLRARLLGHRCLFIPAARVHHHGGATSKRVSERTLRWQARNSIYLLVRTMPGRLLLRAAPGFVAVRLLHLFGAGVRGEHRPLMSGYVEAARDIRWVLRERRRIQRNRRVTVDEFSRVLERRLMPVARSFFGERAMAKRNRS